MPPKTNGVKRGRIGTLQLSVPVQAASLNNSARIAGKESINSKTGGLQNQC